MSEWDKEDLLLWSYIIHKGNSLISYCHHEWEVKWDFYAPGIRQKGRSVGQNRAATITPISEWKCMKVWYIPKSNKKVIMIKVIVTHLPLERVLPVLLHLVVWIFHSGCLSAFFSCFVEMPKILLLTIIVKFFISIKLKYLITSFMLFMEGYRN